MVVAFPLGKILYLIVRQVSKPIAVRLQRAAKQSSFVRTYIIMPPAQGFHKLEMFVKMRLMGAKGPAQVQPLKEERAIEVGAELIGEAFIFTVAAAFVLYEYDKSVKKEEAKKRDIENMQIMLRMLNSRMDSVTKTLVGAGMLKELQETELLKKKANSSLKERLIDWLTSRPEGQSRPITEPEPSTQPEAPPKPSTQPESQALSSTKPESQALSNTKSENPPTSSTSAVTKA